MGPTQILPAMGWFTLYDSAPMMAL